MKTLRERFTRAWRAFWGETKPPPPPVLQTCVKYRRPIQHKKRRCIATDKVGRLEKNAKEKAAQSTYPKLRAYKCPYCDDWHVTKQVSRLTLH